MCEFLSFGHELCTSVTECTSTYLIGTDLSRLGIQTTRPVNPLNAELNPICHLLVLLGDLTFMGPCILSIFQYTCISNKIQRYTVYLYLETALHVSGNNRVYAALGTCYSVWMSVGYAGWNENFLIVRGASRK
jgi:hypothetical protein